MCLAQIGAATEVLGTLAPAASWVGERLSKWQNDKDRLAAAKLEAETARYNAERDLAAWKAKSDVEWDLEWAKQAGTSWRDEYLTVLFTLPLILLFLPWTREFALEGFNALKVFHPDAPTWFMAGNATVVAAAFGIKQAMNFMLPTRFAALAGVMGSLPDDIPESAIKALSNTKSPTK